MQDVYIAREGAAYGPVSMDETNRLVLEGKLDLTTLVWDQKTSNWIVASEHPIIARIFDRHVKNTDDANRVTIVTTPSASAAPAASAASADKTQAEASDLRAEIDKARENFEKDRATATAALEALSSEIKSRGGEKSEIEQALASTKKDLASVQSALSEGRSQKEKLDREIASTEKELQSLGDTLKVGTTLADEAEKTLKERRAERASLEADLKLRRIEAEGLAASLVTQTTEISRSQERVKAIETESADAERVLAEVRADLEGLAAQRAELDAVRAQRLSIADELSRAEGDLERAEIQRAANDAEIEMVCERLTSIRAETAELEEKRIQAQALLGAEVSRAFDEIKSTIGNLGGMTHAWHQAKQSDDTARREGLVAVEEITALLKRRELELSDLFGSLGDQVRTEGERDLAQAAASEAQCRVAEIKEELKSLTLLCYEESERLVEYRRERECIRTEILSEESRISKLLERKTIISTEIGEVTGTMSALQIDLRSLQCEVDALKRERGVHEGAIEELRRLRGNVLDSYMQVENDLSNFTSQATAASARVSELEQKALILEGVIADRNAELEALDRNRENLLALRRSMAEENDAIERSALEARREVETELENMLRELSDVKVRVDAAADELASFDRQREGAGVELARLREEGAIFAERSKLVTAELDGYHERVNGIQERIREREAALGLLRENEAELSARCRRLEEESSELARHRVDAENSFVTLRDRVKVLDADMVMLEKERASRAGADLKDLRELLRIREIKERDHLEKFLGDARVEFKQLREDWMAAERAGITNEDLRKVRTEVEEKRREMAKADRQLSAMRAGLAKLREENGRTLLQRVQSFEMEQLDDLRRRIVESKSEIEALEHDWGKEMKSAELVDKQWFEIKSTVNNSQ